MEIGRRRRRIRIEDLETQIATLEAQLSDIALQLEDPPGDPEKIQHLGEDYVQIQNQINALISEWESLHA